MIPLSGKLKDDLQKKYRMRQNLPINDTKKPSLSECYSCQHYERGPDVVNIGVVHWCVSKEFDKIKKRPVTHYANIELMEICPKKGIKKTFFKKL
jgi:hypothetical protein